MAAHNHHSDTIMTKMRLQKRDLQRTDSLDLESNRLRSTNSKLHGPAAVYTTSVILRLAFQSIGVIYGDVGTSPLYVYSSTFTNGKPSTDDVLGALSLIIYTLTLIPLLKYVFIVLQANDNGNGGTFALYSLICRYAKVSQLPNQQLEDEALSGYKLQDNAKSLARASKIQELLEGSNLAKKILLIMTLLGTCAVIGDGVLTPAISVLSAVDGIQEKFPSLDTNAVVLISIAILVVLFCLQRFGTDKVGGLFAPCVLLWFLFIGGIGIFNIIKHEPSIFRAFSPYYIYKYFKTNKKQGWISLGGIVLCITGTEAMFADLGHFSVASIQIAFTTVVYPSLLAAYIGQGAYLMKFPQDVSQTFYKSIPTPVYWPMFVVAVLASIVASQAMISATFSIVEQSQALGCFPRVKIVHTSSKFAGQVYIPEVNWILMILCVIITGAFKTTTLIGNAYGIAVVAVMLLTTALVTLIMLMIWQTAIYKVVAFCTVFMAIELLYFSSNLYKFDQGGYIPVAFAAVLLIIMYVWHYVSVKKYEFEALHKISPQEVMRKGRELKLARVPGIGLLYTQLVQGVPPIYSHFMENLPAMHAVVVFVSLKSLPVTRVPEEERFLVRRVGEKGQMMYRCVARYGYMEGVGRDQAGFEKFEEALMESLEDFIRKEANSHGIGRGTREGDHHGNTELVEGTELEVVHGKRSEDDGGGRVVEKIACLKEYSPPPLNLMVYSTHPDPKEYSPPPLNLMVYSTHPDPKDYSSEKDPREHSHIRVHSMDFPTRENGSSTLATTPTTTTDHYAESENEIAFLRESRQAGIAYLFGKADVRASPDSRFLKKVVVNVIYDTLHRICRKSTFSLCIPNKRLLEVGMVYNV